MRHEQFLRLVATKLRGKNQGKQPSMQHFLWKKMCVSVCAVNKREQIKEIIQTLLESNTKIGYYNRGDIEKAITISRGLDPRTVKNWFSFLWKLEYFTQPEVGVYRLNLEKVAALEVPLPFQIDPKQKRLGDLPHGL